jgi:hypothetical protein
MSEAEQEQVLLALHRDAITSSLKGSASRSVAPDCNLVALDDMLVVLARFSAARFSVAPARFSVASARFSVAPARFTVAPAHVLDHCSILNPWQLVLCGCMLMGSLMAWHHRVAMPALCTRHRWEHGLHVALTLLALYSMLPCTKASDAPGLYSVQHVPSHRRELHKHITRDSRRILFFHSHTPHTHDPHWHYPHSHTPHSHTPHTHLPPPPRPPFTPPPPSPPPQPPYLPGTAVVSTVAGLIDALANTRHIVLAPGTYYLSAELWVTRSVILEAAVSGTVVLNAQASSSSRRRVLLIDPGSSGVVQLIRLSITGGYIGSVCALGSSKLPIAPPGRLTLACCLQGGGVYISSGTVTITSSSIYGNRANYVRAHVQKFPSPLWENC